jgi:hypothetical protein
MYAEKRRSTYDYQTDLIALTAAKGLTGLKGAKSSTSRRRVAAGAPLADESEPAVKERVKSSMN